MSKKIGDIGSDASKAGTRDAFHVPAIFALCRGPCSPGQWVNLDTEAKEVVAKNTGIKGIIDPFISRDLTEGDLAWVMMDPNLVDKFCHSFDVKGVGKKQSMEELEEEVRRLQREIENHEDYDDGCRGCYS